MAYLTRTTPATRFSSFRVYTTPYKHINTHTVDVSILIPKTIKTGKHPVFVKFHGGGLITGDALYPDWFANYFVDFIHRTNAITVLPNYRLAPEHSGNDILEDLRDLWKWVDEDLARYIASIDPSIELDFDKLLVGGESAGGWMALHSAFHLPQGRIKAMLLQYPMTKRSSNAERVIPLDESTTPLSFIDDHLASVAAGSVLSAATPPARMELLIAFTVHYHRWDERFGTGRHLYPINVLEDATNFPPTLIVHGAQDSMVSLAESTTFVDKIEHVLGKQVREDVRLVVKDGDHGFDAELVEEDTPWLSEELKWVENMWLA